MLQQVELGSTFLTNISFVARITTLATNSYATKIYSMEAIRSTKIWVLIEYYKQIDQLWNHNLVQSKPKCSVSSSVHSFSSFDFIDQSTSSFWCTGGPRRTFTLISVHFLPFSLHGQTHTVRTLCKIIFKLFEEILNLQHRVSIAIASLFSCVSSCNLTWSFPKDMDSF